MAVFNDESSASCRQSASTGAYYLAKRVLGGSAVLQVVQGHIRSPTSQDVVFGKETSIELVVVGEDGIVQSECEHPVFGIIKDLAVLSWSNKFSPVKPQMIGKDILVVISDSGKLSLLTYCNEMHRFFPVAHVHLSNPGNPRHQIGRMLAIDSNSCLIAAAAYESHVALFSVSTSIGDNFFLKKLCYPPMEDIDASKSGTDKNIICGTIWSMCFISQEYKTSSSENKSILAILLNRAGAVINELVLLEWSFKQCSVHVVSRFAETGPLAHHIVEVPNCPGFALLFRAGDVLAMDIRDPFNPSHAYKISLKFSATEVEEQSFSEDTYKLNDMDEEGMFNVAARALLELGDIRSNDIRDDDPMSIDDNGSNMKIKSSCVCSWCWEPKENGIPRIIFCIDTGEYYVGEISLSINGFIFNISDSIFNSQPCKTLAWIGNDFLAAVLEMGDGMVLKVENERLYFHSLIQNIAPVLDMSIVDYNEEKHDQMFACCGMAPEGSLRIIRSGISVEKLLSTEPIYQGVTGIWAIRMKLAESCHSFLVISFVEETRVLSVGLNFGDVTDHVGFLPDVCTLACGLVVDGVLVQIHRHGVRLCLPTILAHHDGISLSSPACRSWAAGKINISLGAVGNNFIIISASSPCILLILGVRMASNTQCEAYVMHGVSLQSELSCISIPQHDQQKPNSLLNFLHGNHGYYLPVGPDIENIFVVGTHKPSVEILSFGNEEGIRVHAVGRILLTNTFGITIAGCIPQDVRLVLVDQLYVLCGLRNGMLLRFEWFSKSKMHGPPEFSGVKHLDDACLLKENSEVDKPISCSTGLQASAAHAAVPTILKLIAVRRIGITPVFMVPLAYSLGADIIVLSERPWLLQAARHTLVYTSISFQPSTHVTPVCSAECPSGMLFVAENSLHLVEMVCTKRLNVQKFHLDGTPRRVLFHSDSRLLFVLRTDLTGDSCSSDVCCVDPNNGSTVSFFKLEYGEDGKSMEFVKVGNEQVIIIGTSLSSGPAIMPSGEAESTKGRLLVLCLVHMQNSDSGSAVCSRTYSSSQRTSPFGEIGGCITDQLSSSSVCSSPDDNSFDEGKLEEVESWQLQLAYSTSWPGVVLAVCSYLDRYFVASAGNTFYVCGFTNDNLQRLRRFAVGRARFMIMSLAADFNRIVVGDCRDGVLFYTYHEDVKKLELLYGDPQLRFVADCVLTDANAAIVSDRKGGVATLSCPDLVEENASLECNLIQNCYYYIGEVVMRIRKGSFCYKLKGSDIYSCYDCHKTKLTSSHSAVAATLLGSIIIFIQLSWEEYKLLEVVQRRLAAHPLTAPILGNDHVEFRSRGGQAGVRTVLDGDMLMQFLELTNEQQEAVLAIPCASTAKASFPKLPASSKIGATQVVEILERVHYSLN